MSHYAKLATLAFRVVSVVLLAYALITSIILAKLAAGFGSPAMLLPGLASFALALILFFAAPLLGRFAALGLDPTPAPPNER